VQARQLRDILAERNLAVVLGGSGSGKSSLVRAGLLPRLNSTAPIPRRAGAWYVVEFRPLTNPSHELLNAIFDQIFKPLLDTEQALAVPSLERRYKAVSQALKINPALACGTKAEAQCLDRLRELLLSDGEIDVEALFEFADETIVVLDEALAAGPRSGPANLLILIDQFEEVFSLPADRQETGLDMVMSLVTTIQTYKPFNLFLIITMRNEWLHRCSELPGVADAMNGSIYLVELLGDSDLEKIILEPARSVLRAAGLGTDPCSREALMLLRKAFDEASAVEQMLDRLPLLQHVLPLMWKEAENDWAKRQDRASFRVEVGHLRALVGWNDEHPLSACLNARAEQVLDEAVEAARAVLPSISDGDARDLMQVAFSRLAVIDGQGNVRRRFATLDQMLDDAGVVQRRFGERKQLGQALVQALEKFRSATLISSRDGSDGELFDINHEALVRNWTTYFKWVKEARNVADRLLEIDRRTQAALPTERAALQELPSADSAGAPSEQWRVDLSVVVRTKMARWWARAFGVVRAEALIGKWWANLISVARTKAFSLKWWSCLTDAVRAKALSLKFWTDLIDAPRTRALKLWAELIGVVRMKMLSLKWWADLIDAVRTKALKSWAELMWVVRTKVLSLKWWADLIGAERIKSAANDVGTEASKSLRDALFGDGSRFSRAWAGQVLGQSGDLNTRLSSITQRIDDAEKYRNNPWHRHRPLAVAGAIGLFGVVLYGIGSLQSRSEKNRLIGSMQDVLALQTIAAASEVPLVTQTSLVESYSAYKIVLRTLRSGELAPFLENPVKKVLGDLDHKLTSHMSQSLWLREDGMPQAHHAAEVKNAHCIDPANASPLSMRNGVVWAPAPNGGAWQPKYQDDQKATNLKFEVPPDNWPNGAVICASPDGNWQFIWEKASSKPIMRKIDWIRRRSTDQPLVISVGPPRTMENDTSYANYPHLYGQFDSIFSRVHNGEAGVIKFVKDHDWIGFSLPVEPGKMATLWTAVGIGEPQEDLAPSGLSRCLGSPLPLNQRSDKTRGAQCRVGPLTADDNKSPKFTMKFVSNLPADSGGAFSPCGESGAICLIRIDVEPHTTDLSLRFENISGQWWSTPIRKAKLSEGILWVEDDTGQVRHWLVDRNLLLQDHREIWGDTDLSKIKWSKACEELACWQELTENTGTH
jgi:hypothetical protein